jgi:hypothetical protein
LTTTSATEMPAFLDAPPRFHQKLLDYGERPYWSPDGRRIAFIDHNYGDVCELDLETREVRNITAGLGEHHSFLRVLFLPSGDYLLIGPREFKDRDISRHVESELWFMDAAGTTAPQPLGRQIFEGIAVSTIENRIAYSTNGRMDPSLPSEDEFRTFVAEVTSTPSGAALTNERLIYEARGGRCPEPQDFRHGDTEVIFSEYMNRWPRGSDYRCAVRGVNVSTGAVSTYLEEELTHNEAEGIFPDHEHISLESSCDFDNSRPHEVYHPHVDLFKMKLDGTGRRVRLTRAIDAPPWKASNSNVSPDGKWLAFMVNAQSDEAGFGRGLGLLDLQAWEASDAAGAWETPEQLKVTASD